MTDCMPRFELDFKVGRPVEVTFDAPAISSDGGLVLLGKLDQKLGLTQEVAALLEDDRDPERVEHDRHEQVRQRVLMIAMGYEDCNDAATMRKDALLKIACGREPNDPVGLSSQPTLSRMENAVRGRSVRQIRRYLEHSYVRELPRNTDVVILDVDTTCDPTHGEQQLSFFNAHYDTNMYHPFMVFDGQNGQLISVMLMPGNAGAARCSPGILTGIIRKIKERFPNVQIVVRGDGAFATPNVLQRMELLSNELGDIYYLLGFGKNSKLNALLSQAMQMATDIHQTTKETERVFADFMYKSGSWKTPRLIIGKAEYGPKGANPRFVVTNIEGFPPRLMYQAYCERGQCENYIKDFKNALNADRLSCHGFLANCLRLLLHAVTYRLMHALRTQVALEAPKLASQQFDTLRIRLLKVGAQVKQSVRRVLIRLSEAFPLAGLFTAVARRIELLPAPA